MAEIAEHIMIGLVLMTAIICYTVYKLKRGGK